MRKREIKITVPFRSYPTCDRKLKKNSKKILNSIKIVKKHKKLKNTIMATCQAKIGRKTTRKFENKNYGFILFQPDA